MRAKEFTFNKPRRQLNIPELIKRGAIFITHPHGPNGWETDRPDWDFSLITLQNVLQKSPDWVVDYKKYLNKDKKLTQNFIDKISDQKYQQILWSIEKLGIPDNVAFLDQQKVIEVKNAGKGDCFEVAGRAMIDPNIPELRLVHAYVSGQGQLEGKRFPHAWNEVGDVVFDNSNGRRFVVRKEQYYDIGKVVTEPGQYAVYDDIEAKKKMIRTRHWGPWDLDEKYENVEEMALSQYKTMGDFNKPGPFRGADKKLVPHPVNQLKTQKFFEKTPYDFRLFFSNIPGTGRYSEYGPMEPNVIKEIFKDQAEQILDGSEDAITVVFVGNKGDAKVMLTPWMMAHRFGHAIQAGMSNSERRWGAWREAEQHFFSQVNNLLNEFYNKSKLNQFDTNVNWSLRQEYNALFNAIGTQRSSRSDQIKRPYEFLYEIFAQYLGTGTIQFNPIPISVGYGRKAWGRDTNRLNIKPQYRDEKERKKVADQLAYDMELMFNDVLSSSVGKVFVM